MKRIVVFGQPGSFGSACCSYVADRLARRLRLPLVVGAGRGTQVPKVAADHDAGWIAIEAVGLFSETMFRTADTAIWLHYSSLAVAREWSRGLRARLAGRVQPRPAPRVADLLDSLQHMAWTPHLRRLLHHPALMHLSIHHLRNPGETEFWLLAQEHRLLPPHASAQPA
jgi:hypothetical protein